jgi:hypothetical protein
MRAGRIEPVHASFLAACRATWADAPVVIAVSAVWALASLPVVIASIAALPIPWVLVSLPFMVVTTGVFRVWAAVAGGRSIEWRQLTRVDPGLAVVAWGLAVAIAYLLTLGDAGVVAACVLGAASTLVLPLAFAYGAVRDRRGRAALRGGLLLAMLHPDLALTLTAMTVLAGFAIVVSAGALVLCAPALIAVFACVAVIADLRRLGAIPVVS